MSPWEAGWDTPCTDVVSGVTGCWAATGGAAARVLPAGTPASSTAGKRLRTSRSLRRWRRFVQELTADARDAARAHHSPSPACEGGLPHQTNAGARNM